MSAPQAAGAATRSFPSRQENSLTAAAGTGSAASPKETALIAIAKSAGISRNARNAKRIRIEPSSGSVDVAHAQAHAALAVDFEHLHAHVVAFLELVGHALDALLADLRDVHQAVAP